MWFITKWLADRQAKRIEKFVRHRTAQSSESFLAACRIPTSFEQAYLAIKIRETLAELGKVPVELLYAQDRFDLELDSLPLCRWFYNADFIDLLESKTGMKLAREIPLPQPDVPPRGMTVADFVQHVLIVTGKRWNVHMKYCCKGFEFAVSQRAERSVSITAEEMYDAKPLISIAVKAVADADQEKLARHGKILQEAGVEDHFSMTLVAYTPIKYCPWCGVKVHKFYRHSWRGLPKPER